MANDSCRDSDRHAHGRKVLRYHRPGPDDASRSDRDPVQDPDPITYPAPIANDNTLTMYTLVGDGFVTVDKIVLLGNKMDIRPDLATSPYYQWCGGAEYRARSDIGMIADHHGIAEIIEVAGDLHPAMLTDGNAVTNGDALPGQAEQHGVIANVDASSEL